MGIYCVLCTLILPIIMLIAGWAMYRSPSEDTSMGMVGYGYKSKRSLASRACKSFADKYAGKVFMIYALVMLPLSLIASIILVSNGIYFKGLSVIMVVQVICLCTVHIPVERALKKNFDENGDRITAG